MDAFFTAGSATSTEEHSANFALSAFDVGKIVIVRATCSARH